MCPSWRSVPGFPVFGICLVKIPAPKYERPNQKHARNEQWPKNICASCIFVDPIHSHRQKDSRHRGTQQDPDPYSFEEQSSGHYATPFCSHENGGLHARNFGDDCVLSLTYFYPAIVTISLACWKHGATPGFGSIVSALVDRDVRHVHG